MASKRETSRYRAANSPKGTDASIERTIEGLPVQTEEYLPGMTNPDDIPDIDFHEFTMKQFMFLDEYAKDLDVQRAAREAGVERNTARGWIKLPKIRAEMEAIYAVWRKNRLMKAETAAARHITLMDKMERDYDNAEDLSDKAKMANPLSKMSDSYLKAAGMYAGSGSGTESNVVINIDLGEVISRADNAKEINIKADGK